MNDFEKRSNGWLMDNYPLIVVIVIAAVLLLFAAIINANAKSVPTRKTYSLGDRIECMGPLTRDRIKNISVDALDDSFKDHLKELFRQMMRDMTDQPKRASDGTHKAIYGYLAARDLMSEFNPQACEGEQRPEERR